MWHYVNDNQSVGPVSTDEMRDLIMNKLLGGDSLVWTEGMAEWARLEDVQDLSVLLRAVPPPVPVKVSDGAVPDLVPSRDSQDDGVEATRLGIEKSEMRIAARPWQRFWARILDVWLYVFAASIVGGFVVYAYFPKLYLEILSMSELALGVVLLPIALVFIALTSTILGTSPGRWLFGVRVNNLTNTNRLSFHLQREAGVWLKGLALGIPIFALFTEAHQYNRLKAGKPASYDEGRSFVEDTRAGAARVATGWVVIALLLCAQIYLATIDGNDAAASRTLVAWPNPVTGEVANLSGTWARTEIKNPGVGQIFYFVSDENLAEALIGIEPTQGVTDVSAYASALETALSDKVEFGNWRAWSVAGQPVLKSVGQLREDTNMHAEITVTIIGENAWRTILFTRGRAVDEVPSANDFVSAVFDTL